MGLQGQVSDCSSESIPILVVALLANCVNYLRSVAFTVLRSMNLSRTDPIEIDEGLIGSGLAGLIFLAEQLNLNRILSHRHGADCATDPADSACVVCLSELREGEQVRRLACRHVFHKACFDGWLDQLRFSCPLCRSPLVSERSVGITERRVTQDVVRFFSVQ
ncbi:E3 ubiquitin-protein like [Actinidia chinensis var. chinensis]|uniref:E3 ubiquitin-protein like n=1 Tax=Actinidia chinensis var. chinensis TaxID=1590841 RepID=A0A2R6PGY5_ACTCC|nr:E3 ubiquitin-protein like [Actinidia chinensis var. chinensis]